MESREEVASSYTRTGESFSTALAMATLCFSPPTCIIYTQYHIYCEQKRSDDEPTTCTLRYTMDKE